MASEIISRKDALAKGLKRYFTGKPCKYGHISERRISSDCIACGVAFGTRRQAEQRQKKPSYRSRANSPRAKAKLAGEIFYFTGKACKKSGHVSNRYTSSGYCVYCSLEKFDFRELRAERFNAIKNDQPKYFTGEPCIHGHVDFRASKNGHCFACAREDSRKRYYSRVLTSDQVASRKEYAKNWCKENRERANALARNYTARKKSARGSHSASDVKDLLRLQRGKCAYCSVVLKAKYHIDHITPLSRGGDNDRRNLQALCRTCNLNKCAKDPILFARERGFLL